MKWTAAIALCMLLGIAVAYRLSLPVPEDSFYRNERTDRPDMSDMTEKTERTNRSDRTVRVEKQDNVTLTVPFQPQAPFGDWRQPWGEACEEAALVLANRFARQFETLTQAEMRDEILKLVEYQNKEYGDYKDSDAARTAQIGREVYGISMEAKAVNGVEEVKEMLREGNLVIAPMAGRLLKNPYFRQPGPWYHMLVVRGFDDEKKEFITNDVGTRRGEGFRYSYPVFWKALHDFPGEKEMISQGEKKIIVVTRLSE